MSVRGGRCIIGGPRRGPMWDHAGDERTDRRLESRRVPNVDPAKVEEVIDIIRPAIQADGGDITLLGIDDESGVVTVELHGACVSCPASTITMKAGVERIMKDRVPGVTSVVQPSGDTETGTHVSL